jgi:transcriptional regulator with XRE-family HTH domain
MTDARPKSLGERIRELREARDLSLREFGKKLKLSAAFLSDVELGRRHPSDKFLAEMARVLGTSLEELKSYDLRPTVQELKRLVAQNPAYGFAFRKVMDKGMSPEDLVKLVEKKPDRKGR